MGKIAGFKPQYHGINTERKVLNRKKKELKRGKHFYAKEHSFSRNDGVLPSKYVNQIVCEDSLKVLRSLPDNCIDLVFTFPPYNFGLDYENEGDDATDWQGYFDQLFAILGECVRLLKFGGRMIVNIQPLFSDYIPLHHYVSNFLMQQKMIWKGEIIWEKNNYNCKYTAWGSWKSPSSPYLKYTWEFLEVFCKGDLKKLNKAENIDIAADDFKSWVYAKWSIAPERRMKELGHPAIFPEELARRVLQLFSFKGDFILDPFNGVGTTCVVAKRYNRKYLGIDISDSYCSTALDRLIG